MVEPRPFAGAPAPSLPLTAAAGVSSAKQRVPALAMTDRPLPNRFAYIPPQCYTKTQDDSGRVANPCFVCHSDSQAPNYVADVELQQVMKLPPGAAENPWSNVFTPAIERIAASSDAELLAYVRTSNYFAADGGLILAQQLAALPEAWDGDGDAHWGGYVPDAWFHFDERGFDLRPDGTPSGWRAFAFYPLPGTFFPTNGSAGDVLIRLDPALREDVPGHFDRRVAELNLAIVEALIGRRDVPIETEDETHWGVDLDLDGKLGSARHVAFDARELGARMHYVGRAQLLQEAGKFPIAAGLFPLGTEFLHTLRYLDVSNKGRVSMAERMKELRYAKKVRWFSYADLKAHTDAEAVELSESASGALHVLWQFDRGVYNAQGWLLQAFIEAKDGSLRPQTYEETAFCVGCHGGIGATTDGMFAFARKLTHPASGYFHWTQHDLRGLREPQRADGTYEYTFYLQQNHAGDEFRENREIAAQFFDRAGGLRAAPSRALHGDVASLLLPSRERALALDRAYRAVVIEQSFTRGRDATLAPSTNVQKHAIVLAKTGVTHPVRGAPLLAVSRQR